MGIAEVELPDGKKARIEFTDQAQLDSTVADLSTQHPKKEEVKAPETPKEIPATWTGAAKGVGDAALTVASGIAQQVVGVPKHLAALAEQVTSPLSRMTPEQKAQEAKTNAQPGITEKLQGLLSYTPKTDEGKYLLKQIQDTLQPISQIAGQVRQVSEATIGKPATDVASDVIGLAGVKGAGSASKLGGAISKATSTESKVRALMEDLSGGRPVGSGEVGGAVKGAIAKTSEAAKKEGSAAYTELDRAMGAKTVIRTEGSAMEGQKLSSRVVVDPTVKKFADKLQSTPAMTFEDLKDLRTQISDSMGSDRNVNRQLRTLRDSVTKDIEKAAEGLGPEAKQAWDTANANWTAYTKGQDAINRVLTKNWQGKTSTEIYNKVLRAAKSDPEKIKTVVGAIKDPEVRKQFAASVLHQMSDKEGVFNGDKLVREWGNMDPAARRTLFSSVGGTYETDMSRLVEKLNRIREGHTGLVKEVSGVGVAAILAHLIPGGTKIIGGITLIREGYKFSPATVEKLLKSPQAVKDMAALALTTAKRTTGAVTVGAQQGNRIGDLTTQQPARVGDVQ